MSKTRKRPLENPEQIMEEATFMTLKIHLDNFHDAEDAAADGVLAMLEAKAKADPEKGNPEHFMRKSGFGAIHNFLYYNARRRQHESVTLNAPCDSCEEGNEYIDLLPEDESAAYQTRRTQTENDLHMRALVESLPEKSRTVIRGRFFDKKTLDTLGEEMGITRERVRQIEAKALDTLRHRYLQNA